MNTTNTFGYFVANADVVFITAFATRVSKGTLS